MAESKITFPDRAIIRLDFPARGAMPPANNLADKGRSTGKVASRRLLRSQQTARPINRGRGSRSTRVRRLWRNHLNPASSPATERGLLVQGHDGHREREEGVWSLPSARSKEYVLPPELLTPSPGHMLDWVRACKGGDACCSDFSYVKPVFQRGWEIKL